MTTTDEGPDTTGEAELRHLGIRPEEAVLPGRRDPSLLLTAWFTRRSATWVAGLAAIAARIQHLNDVGFGFDSPAAALTLLALLLRIVPNIVALFITWPLIKEYEGARAPRTGITRWIGIWLDRRHLARALRALRWTHFVRQHALAQLGSTGDRLRKLDPILDVVNIVAVLIGTVALTFLIPG